MFRVRVLYFTVQSSTTFSKLSARHCTCIPCCTLISRNELRGHTDSLSYCSGMSKWDLVAILLRFIISLNTLPSSSLHLWTWPKNPYHTTFREIVYNDWVRCFICLCLSSEWRASLYFVEDLYLEIKFARKHLNLSRYFRSSGMLTRCKLVFRYRLTDN
jgi:hypothetical protein